MPVAARVCAGHSRVVRSQRAMRRGRCAWFVACWRLLSAATAHVPCAPRTPRASQVACCAAGCDGSCCMRHRTMQRACYGPHCALRRKMQTAHVACCSSAAPPRVHSARTPCAMISLRALVTAAGRRAERRRRAPAWSGGSSAFGARRSAAAGARNRRPCTKGRAPPPPSPPPFLSRPASLPVPLRLAPKTCDRRVPSHQAALCPAPMWLRSCADVAWVLRRCGFGGSPDLV